MRNRKRDGFTLLELLVVIVIVAIMAALSLPAILKARKQASINKAQAEMTSLASTGATIYIDLKSGGYVLLANYSVPKPPAFSDVTKTDTTITGYNPAGDFSVNFTLADFQTAWDGPYAVWQPNTTFNVPPGTGTYPKNSDGTALPASAAVTVWSQDKFPTGTPLDPWGHPYGMAWNNTDQVMVIYSAGPDGKFGIGATNTNPGDESVVTGSDDLLYKFR